MLKLRKIFSLGVVVAAIAALGLMVSSCVEPVDYYTVEIASGDVDIDDEATGTARPGATGAGSNYEAGDVVTIKAGTPLPGQVFVAWTCSDPYVVFADPTEPITTFTMPANDVVVGAWWQDGAKVRYTWERAEQSNIQSIAASYNDVKFWYETVYMAEDYIEEDASDVPMHDGSDIIPDNIYSKTIGSTQYKGKYLDIYEDKYTAVCTVDDPAYDNIADIVANYDITFGSKAYFEVAFDVGAFLEGVDELGWFDDNFGDPYTNPRLTKTPGKKLVKKIEKEGVTYYVLHRARK